MAVRSTRIKDLGEMLRDILDRLGRLERRNRVVIGSGAAAYVLEVNAGGDLTARHATTGTVTTLASP